MNSYKVVTVCSSDTGQLCTWNNYFRPDRRSLSRGELRFISTAKSRIRSAPLSSVLKPVSYTELRNNLPLLVTQNNRSMNCRSGSVDSDILRKEINSAVLLLESRNEADMLTEGNEKRTVLSDELTGKCHYKVYDRNHLSQSAQRIIEQRVQTDFPRWQSAKISRDINEGNKIKTFHLRMLSSKHSVERKTYNNSTTATAKDVKPYDQQKEINPNLIISSSNSLTNFITIDDISGAKKYWMKGKERFYPTVEVPSDIKLTIDSPKDGEEIQLNAKGRDDILREYMDVYMHWRTINAIEEHGCLVNGKGRDIKSAKIRSSTPKERLEQFKSTINERQVSSKKKYDALVTTVDNNEPHFSVTNSPDTDSPEYSSSAKTEQKEKEVKADCILENNSKVEDVTVVHEIEKDPLSDEYSDIDWLECEDI